MTEQEQTILEQINKLTRRIQVSNLTIVRTVSGAGAPMALKTIIQDLRLNTYFTVESPRWFDFESLEKYYANNNRSKVDLYAFILDRDDCSDRFPFSEIRDIVNQNNEAKVLVLTNGVTLTDISDSDNYVRYDFHKII